MKHFFLFVFVCWSWVVFAQPGKIHYQGVAYNSSGLLVKNTAIGIRFSILDSISTGTVLYSETHHPTTDASGLFSVYIGAGTPVTGVFSDLPWANGKEKFLKVEMDITGGTSYLLIGVSPLVSVPYAITAGSLVDGTILYGKDGKNYKLTVTSSGPVWSCYPPAPIADAGPGQLNLTGTTATLAANAPAAGETGAWSILIGSGGSFSSTSNPTATFTKGTDTAYTLVWTILGPCGSSSDTVLISFQSLVMNIPCPGISSVSYLGENYPTVRIGNQCWLAKNLNVGTMINSSIDQSNNGVVEKYCYNNNSTNCTTYGGLYQWAEAMKYQNGASNSTSLTMPFNGFVRGICPSGWHLPSEAEFCTLFNYLDPLANCNGNGQVSTIVGGMLNSTSSLWKFRDPGISNSSGFSALPGGISDTAGFFNLEGDRTYFWSSSESSSVNAFIPELGNFVEINAYYDYKGYGVSVRCILDSCSPTTSSAGPDQLNLTGTTATLAANAPAAGETGAWSILIGSGGSFSSTSNPTATFTRGTDTAYTLVWTISGPCVNSSDTVNLRFPFQCGQGIYYAGLTYPTVQIGTQCWLAKNLNVGTSINSSSAVDSQRNNGIIEKYCYSNSALKCDTFGGLYQWAEAVQYQNGANNTALTSPTLSGNIRGICPLGWHLPADAEWTTLETSLGGASVAGGALKSTSIWNSPNTGATNSSGFNAFPAGYRLTTGGFSNQYTGAFFWSTLEATATQNKARFLGYNGANLSWANQNKGSANSVRCIKD